MREGRLTAFQHILMNQVCNLFPRDFLSPNHASVLCCARVEEAAGRAGERASERGGGLISLASGGSGGGESELSCELCAFLCGCGGGGGVSHAAAAERASSSGMGVGMSLGLAQWCVHCVGPFVRQSPFTCGEFHMRKGFRFMHTPTCQGSSIWENLKGNWLYPRAHTHPSPTRPCSYFTVIHTLFFIRARHAHQ